jgi:DNA-binding NtrC family response regulator
VRVGDLDLRELLHFDPQGGVLRFAGQRSLLFDAVALGVLRKELISLLGMSAARVVLARFGYAQGWRTAEALRTEIPWEDEGEWRRSGGKLHALLGHVRFEVPPVRQGVAPPFAEAIWRDSYEAEQHLLQLGRADEPVCWTLTGFASGYLSCVNGREILCREERCAGQGHETCAVVGRPREEWERLEPGAAVTTAFERAPLEAALAAVGAGLARASRLRAREAGAVEPLGAPGDLVVRSDAMRRVLELARRVARVDSTVLVTGESGVGKERIARLVHEGSARAARPWVALNCAAIPEPLVESELFGHARGAFTGAAQDRPGLFEAASGGTLFLDEVGELPAATQPKLLRALETREVRRVGESLPRPVDVRLVAATNRDLAREVAAGRFRRDLLYRLKVVEIAIPPLRERPEDVLEIARLGLEAAARRHLRAVAGFTPRAADQLARYPWPGNVRELLNAVERAAVLCGDRVDLDDLPEEVRTAQPGGTGPGARTLEWLEKEAVLAALRENGGNRTRAAAQLGIGPATLYRRLRAWRVRG